jgi:hypothetical protein
MPASFVTASITPSRTKTGISMNKNDRLPAIELIILPRLDSSKTGSAARKGHGGRAEEAD